MQTAVVREFRKRPRHSARLPRGWVCAGVLIGAGAMCSAQAADWASETASFNPMSLAAPAGAAPGPGSVIEISASNLPRFDNFDASDRTQQRVDMALLSPGRSSFGVTMGLSGPGPLRYGFNAGAAQGLNSANLGVQWRYILDNNRRIDITAWREMGRPNDALSLIQSRDTGYGARVEMQLAGSHSPLVADRGFVGVRLDSGARITLRRSAGKPMVYYRTKF